MPAMSRTTLFAAVDRAMDGRLADWLIEQRSDGLSLGAIAAVLYAESGLLVSAPTVSAWILNIQSERAGAAS